MTRTGVLSLLVAACAVTNSYLAYARPTDDNPRHLQSGRSMQAFLSSSVSAPNLDEIKKEHDQVFSQFIDTTIATRLEGHITTDKIFYKPGDAVFMDLLVLNTVDKTPYFLATNDNARNVSVRLLASDGSAVTGVSTVNKLLFQGPAHGFTIKLPTTITAGRYLIVASHPFMATATRTLVVQALPAAAAATTTAQPTITWNFFQPTLTQSLSGLGAKATILDTNGVPLRLTKVQYKVVMDATNPASVNFVETTTGYDGAAYIYFSIASATPTSVFAITLTNLPGATLVFSDLKTINIGNTFPQISFQNNAVITPSIDYTRMTIMFFSETMSDLVPQVPNTVYFRSQLKATATAEAEPFDFKGATLFAYDPQLPAVGVQVVQSGVSTTKGGFGVLNPIVYDDSKIYFLEFNAPNYTPKYGDYETQENLFLPKKNRVILKNAAIRFPVDVDGIQTQLSRIEIQKFNSVATNAFPMNLLFDYEYEVTATYDAAGNKGIYGYSNGYFYLKMNFVSQPAVRLPPLLVFNNFPLPEDFGNILMNATENRLSGVATKSTQTAGYVAYGSTTATQVDFDAFVVSQNFYKHIVGDLEAKFPTQFQKLGIATRNQFTSTGSPMSDADKKTNIGKIRTVFSRIPLVPQTGSNYYGKYGAINSQVAKTYLPLSTIVLDRSQTTPPTIAMSIADKTLTNTQDLVVEISTNIMHDLSNDYIIQIRSNEKIVYQQKLDLKRRMQKEKLSISASNFVQPNGGILQVSLQRVRPDFYSFVANFASKTACDLTTITSAYKSMSTTNKDAINRVAAYDVGEYEMSSVIPKLQIQIPGTTCTLIGPDLVHRFLEPVGSVLVFKEPASKYELTLGSDCSNNVCTQNRNTNLNIQLRRFGTTTNVASAVDGTFKATVIITKAVDDGKNAYYNPSTYGKVLLENEIDTETYKSLDPLAQADAFFTTTAMANYMDILLVVNNVRFSVFDSKVYRLLKHNEDIFNFFKNQLPQTYEQLSQIFGYNFQMNDYNQDTLFYETDIRNFIKASATKNNIANLVGSDQTYAFPNPTIDLFSNVQTAVLTTAWRWAATLSASNYNAFDAPYQAMTQYFENNIDLSATGAKQVQFTTADTPGFFNAIVYTYGAKGISYAKYQYYVRPSVAVDFTLPANLCVNDNVNITVKISNGEGQALSIVPSLTANPAVTADFNYDKWTINPATGLPVSTPNTQTYTVLSTESEQLVYFQLRAVSTLLSSDLEFKFQITYQTNRQYTLTVRKSITMCSAVENYSLMFAGQLSTSQHNTYPYMKFDSTFNVQYPGNQVVLNKFVLYPTDAARVFYNTRRVWRFPQVDASLSTLIGKLEQTASALTTFPSTIHLNPEFRALQQEAAQYMIAGVKQFNLFQVQNVITKAILGLDEFRYTNQMAGDLVVTANALSFILQNYDLLATDATLAANLPAMIVSNMQWLMDQIQDAACTYTLNSNIRNVYSDAVLTKVFLLQQLSLARTNFVAKITGATFTAQRDTLNGKIVNFINACTNNALATGVTQPIISQLSTTNALTTNPHLLALSVVSFGAAKGALNPASDSVKITQLQGQIEAILVQLVRHVSHKGEIEFPVNQNSPLQLNRDIVTVYGGLANDRQVETQALALMAFKLSGSPATFAEVIKSVGFHLRTFSQNGDFAFPRMTALANQALALVEMPLTPSAVYKVRISLDTTVNYRTITIGPNQWMPIEIQIPSTDLPAAKLNYANIPMTITITELNTAATVSGAPVDSVLAWEFFGMSYGPIGGVTSSPVYQNDLTLAVTSMQDPTMLGKAANLGKTFTYKVTVFNQNAKRSFGAFELILRFPACLNVDPLQFNNIIGGLINNVVSAWDNSIGDQSVRITSRGLQSRSEVSFTYSGVQVFSGDCKTRVHSLYGVQTSNMRVAVNVDADRV